ncbi:MAG: hypothetical protein V1809_08405 [Planctomycetota bacterium]
MIPRMFFAAVLLAAATLPADTVVLKNGDRIEGKVTENSDKGVSITVTRGNMQAVFHYRKDEVASIEAGADPAEILREEYQTRLAKVANGGTADGWFALGEWCAEKLLKKEAEAAWRKTLTFAPDHEGARRALGYRRHQGTWMTEEEVRMAEGYVKFRGQWVKPEERDRILADESDMKKKLETELAALEKTRKSDRESLESKIKDLERRIRDAEADDGPTISFDRSPRVIILQPPVVVEEHHRSRFEVGGAYRSPSGRTSLRFRIGGD